MKALKAFVVWLLLAVIPVQGMTVNIVMAANAAHRSAAHESGIAQDNAQHAQHIHHRAATLQSADAHCDHQQPDEACPSSHAKAAGGSCASFCPLSMWMPVGELTMPVVENVSLHIVYIAFHVPFVIPDRPEHPPRFLSV